MPKPRAKKLLPVKKLLPASNKRAPKNWLREAVAKLTKEELVDFVAEMARADTGIRRKLETRFQLEPSGRDLVAETASAISNATDFDERQINQNFSYDYEAYDVVKRNFGRLAASGNLREAMALSLELMRQGSYQVEMSDEGLMSYEIEECLQVVIKALQKSDLPVEEVRQWCEEMARKDRIQCICRDELRSLQDRSGKRRAP